MQPWQPSQPPAPGFDPSGGAPWPGGGGAWPDHQAWPAGPPLVAPPAAQLPTRLLLAAAVLLAGAVVNIGQIATLVYAVSQDPEAFYIGPILVLVLWLGWLGYLAYGLLAGRGWIKKVVLMSMPLVLPFCVLYPAILGPDAFSDITDGSADLGEYVQLAAVLLCLVNIPLAVLPMVLVTGPEVTGYLKGRR